jgi:hypothetical protein
MSIRYDYRAAPWGVRNAANTDLYELPSEYRPTMIWALETQKDRNDWDAAAAHIAGHQAMCASQWELIMGTATERLEGASNRIYALLDATLNAVPRIGMFDPATGATAFTPPIPDGPGTIAIKAIEPRHNELYVEVSAQNVTLGEIKLLLEQLVAADNAEEIAEIIAKLTAIAAAL